MNYAELLSNLIEKSGLTQKEITNKCKEYGVEISTNYISILKTTEKKMASDVVSKAIAKACNAEYEDILAIQSYIDKAPKPILDFLTYAKETTTVEALMFIEGNKENLPEYEYKKLFQNITEKYNNETLAEFICETLSDMTLPTEEGFKQNLEIIKKKMQSKDKNLWALVPIDKEKDIRYLTESEVLKIKS